MDEKNEEAVAQFCGITAASTDQARFFLESSNWQLDSAIHSFFETEGGAETVTEPLPTDYDAEDEHTSAPSAAPVAPGGLGGPLGWGIPPSSGSTQRVGSFASKPKSKDKGAGRKNSAARGGITTLSDLNRHPDSDSDSDGPQEYYTGGEKSGMMVQDPSRGSRDVDAIFDRVRQSGAREGPEPPRAVGTSSNRSFGGTGRILSGEPRQPEETPAAAAAAGTGLRPTPEPVFHTITFWRNGFTVDDGPLRRLDDPANAPFLDSINKTECPRELEPVDRNTPVHVNLVKKDEEWQAPPEPKYVAFQGSGRTLGSTSQTAAPGEVSSVTIPVTLEAANQPFQGLVVDDAKPSTSIQLRLSDGTRMVARFNHTHTIADIRSFIDAARPGSSGPYQLQTMGFPPKQLTDSKQTVEGAGLINSVVIQKA